MQAFETVQLLDVRKPCACVQTGNQQRYDNRFRLSVVCWRSKRASHTTCATSLNSTRRDISTWWCVSRNFSDGTPPPF